jgi:hypothetical protein
MSSMNHSGIPNKRKLLLTEYALRKQNLDIALREYNKIQKKINNIHLYDEDGYMKLNMKTTMSMSQQLMRSSASSTGLD